MAFSEERQQWHRFHFEIDRRRYLVTRALVRTTLSRYAAVRPREWTFAANAYGKPVVANPDQRARQISFNVSHTKNLILLGVTSVGAIGVDVENCRSREAPLNVAHQFFAPKELAELRALPKAQQNDRFFEYWTLKESYIKARGMGLSIRLDLFSFNFPDERTVHLSMQPLLNDSASRWRFWQLRPNSSYVAAVCAEATEVSQQIVTRMVVPLLREEIFNCNFVRTTQMT
jgi:4'-phosphopantetheinyl transferase